MTTVDQREQQVEFQSNVGIQNIYVNTPSGKRIPLFKPPRAPHFTNRKTELEKLLKDLSLGKLVTICATGGMGKTALVTEAIWTLAPDNQSPQRFPDGILFHTFYNQPSADVALESIAHALGEEPKPTPAAGAQRALSGKRVLLVLDGAEAADDLKKIYDSSGGCAVLVTSRRSEDAFDDWSDLKSLATEESVELLQAWAQHQADDSASVRAICEIVGNLPLAVRLAAFYLSHRKVNASRYLEWLQASPLQALDHGKRREQSVPILLQRSLDQVGQEAKSTLALIGRRALAPFDSTVISEALGIPVYAAEDRLGQLVNWGFLNIGDTRYQVTHALIHSYARERLVPDDESLRRLIVYSLALIRTETGKGAPGYRRLDQERAHLLYLIGVCMEQGRFEESIQFSSGIARLFVPPGL
ncbi:MAG: NB-ARC domain-containing protein [Methylococcales bacterium]